MQATGIDFYAQIVCTLTNSGGVGPDCRMQVALFMDGVHHGEVKFIHTPTYFGTYETMIAGSLLERIPPTNFYGTHTFDVRVWGLKGALAVQECNLNVWSFPNVIE